MLEDVAEYDTFYDLITTPPTLQRPRQYLDEKQSSVKTEIGTETSRSKSFARYVFCTPGAGLGISFVCRIAPAMNFKSAETRAVLRRSSWVSTQRSV